MRSSSLHDLSTVYSSRLPRNMKRFDIKKSKFDIAKFEKLKEIGIHLDEYRISEMCDSKYYRKYLSNVKVSDSLQPTVTTGSIVTPIQFLQAWLPGFVFIDTGARNIDEFIGMSIVGEWEEAQVVQPIMELTNLAVPYGDYTNVPLASWNVNFNYRSVIRFEQGMMVGVLESETASRIRVDVASTKRQSCAQALELIRNMVGFYGYNNGLNLTYGFLTDPGETSYVTVPNGASGSPLWSTKTFLEIQKDINAMIIQLRTQSQDLIDPERINMTLALASAVVDQLAKTSNFGISVKNWLNSTYPRVRIVSAPELTAANGGANVGYMYAETVDAIDSDMSTDDGKVFDQWVPSKFMVVGVEQRAKGYIEDYSNSLAGVACKRPWGNTRITGI